MARQFDAASSQFVQVDTAIPNTAVPLTFACWAYSTSSTTLQHLFGAFNSGSPQDRFVLWFDGASTSPTGVNDILRVYVDDAASGGSGSAYSTTAYSLNTWHHCCGVFSDPKTRIAYLDGGSKETRTTVVDRIPAGINRTSIGRAGDSTPNIPLAGRVTEIGVWNVVLTDAEVASLAAGYAPPFVRPESLIHYPTMIGEEDIDLVGGLKFIPFNGPTVADGPAIISQSSPRLFTGPRAVADLGPNF